MHGLAVSELHRNFPQTLLELLLVYNRRVPNAARAGKVFHTLDCMAHGGIRDQLGGAFHRYSTDAEWLIPHFEIMLYDNAMLAWCYIEAYRQTEDRRYSSVARGILDFVLREMTSPEGGFYTAFDAEVDAEEGQTYLWTRAEVEAALAAAMVDDPQSEAKIHRFCRVYGLDDGPNFADPHHGNGLPDKNILFLAEPTGEKVPALLDQDLCRMREILLATRKLRKQPSLDTKIITSWNALMIRALAAAGFVLQEKKYIDAATKAADFLVKTHGSAGDSLYRTSRDGVTKYAGFLDDYAFLIQAMIALADSGGSERWKDSAKALAQSMINKFGDPKSGGFYFNEAGAADVIIRQKIATDSPLPSGNGVAAMVLLALGQRNETGKAITVFARQLEKQAEGMSALLQAAALYLQENQPLLAPARSGAVTVPISPQEQSQQVLTIAPIWRSPTQLDVQVQIREGMHISAHDTVAGMMATQLAISGDNAALVASIEYPPAQPLKVEFSELAIFGYQQTSIIKIVFSSAPQSGSHIELALHYQPCDEKACLPAASKAASVIVPVQ